MYKCCSDSDLANRKASLDTKTEIVRMMAVQCCFTKAILPPDRYMEYGMRSTHLQRQQAYESGETLCGHEAHTVTRITHAAQHRHHQKYNVGYNIHIQLLHHT